MNCDIWWDGISGYAASCWRALSECSGVRLNVLAYRLKGEANSNFSDKLVEGLPVQTESDEGLVDLVHQRRQRLESGLLIVSGWGRRAYTLGVKSIRNAAVKKVLAFDTPWLGSVKDHLRTLYVRRYARNFDAAFVPGERGYQFARKIGFGRRNIFKGLYAVDSSLLMEAYERRRCKKWPKRFLFIGRFIDAKDLLTLVAGYELYRAREEHPWPLTIVGMGPQQSILTGRSGIELLGFVQPHELVELWESHGAFVIASKYDPWPLVIVEACRAGLPIVHSAACGSAVELVREFYNGYSFPTGSPESLAYALRRLHNRYNDLELMGSRSLQLSNSYCSEIWAKVVLEIAETLVV